jgi:hypothetical protein
MENLQWDQEVDFQLSFITSLFGYYAKKGYKVGLRDVNRKPIAWMKKIYICGFSKGHIEHIVKQLWHNSLFKEGSSPSMVNFEWRSLSSFLVGQDGYFLQIVSCIIINHLNALIITSWIVKVFNCL